MSPIPGHRQAGLSCGAGVDAVRRSTRRKLLIALGAGALAAPLLSLAQQQGKDPQIGLLSAFSPSDTALWYQAFRLGLRDLGWVEGKNISIEYRYAEGRRNLVPDLAADLVRLKVDVIVASVLTDAQAAQKATRAIPIVVAAAGDLVGSGLVESLARPGGTITGLTQMAPELTGKRLELIKEMVPKLSRVAVLWNPLATGSALAWQEIQLPARQLGIQLHSLEVRSTSDVDTALEDATRAHAGALFIAGDPVVLANLKRIADFATKSRLPSIFQFSDFANVGGLVTYGPDLADMYRRAAAYVDKILKGAKPGDLPVEQPTKFEMVINMKTAKALGIKIPNSILVRANKVIE